MDCPFNHAENASLLLDYCERKLSPELAASVARHVELCADCRKVVDAQREVWQALDAWDPEPVSPDFNRRLYQRIAAEESHGWWRGFVEVLSLRPAMPVAVACLAVMAVLLLQSPVPPVTNTKAAMEAIDVDQVETTLDDVEMLHQLGVDAGPEDPSAGKAL